ncbi:MAG: hypothetical protein ABIN80_05315 [Dyadobacter sp.]|uniref:hypothetical protein n=1 Tax=Dyadobacter sp. TaxID=1914288 RepID=UPI0032639E0D
MKNLFANAVFTLSTLFLFSCNNSNDPTPNGGSGTENAVAQAGVSTITSKVENPIINKQPIPENFEWKLMTSVQLPMNKGLNLSAPFDIVNETAGDISWGSDGGCYQALRCWKVTRAILGIVDFKSVTPGTLKALPFVKGQIAWAPGAAPGYTPTWPNYMPVGTVIAYKTSLNKFRIVVVKSISPLVLDVYHENYYRVY